VKAASVGGLFHFLTPQGRRLDQILVVSPTLQSLPDP
jgi:hypothetical protein